MDRDSADNEDIQIEDIALNTDEYNLPEEILHVIEDALEDTLSTFSVVVGEQIEREITIATERIENHAEEVMAEHITEYIENSELSLPAKENTAEIEQQSERIESIESRINVVQDTVNEKFGELDERISTLATQVDSFENKLTSVERQVGTIADDVEDLHEATEGLWDTTDRLRETVHTKIESQNTKINSTKESAETIAERMDEIEEIAPVLKGINTDTIASEEFISKIEKRLTRKVEAVSNINRRLEDTIDELKTRLTNVEGQVEGHEDHFERVEQDLDDFHDLLLELKQSVRTQESKTDTEKNQKPDTAQTGTPKWRGKEKRDINEQIDSLEESIARINSYTKSIDADLTNFTRHMKSEVGTIKQELTFHDNHFDRLEDDFDSLDSRVRKIEDAQI